MFSKISQNAATSIGSRARKTNSSPSNRNVTPKRYAYRSYTDKANVLLYLSGLQLMALIVRPATLLVFDRLDEEFKSFSKKASRSQILFRWRIS
jgi:hypothetical protein